MTEIAKQLQWIQNLYEELGLNLSAIPVCIDNQGAIFLAMNPTQEERSKHVHKDDHYIREAIIHKELDVLYVPTNQQVADIFTKNLGGSKFQDRRKGLCMISYAS